MSNILLPETLVAVVASAAGQRFACASVSIEGSRAAPDSPDSIAASGIQRPSLNLNFNAVAQYDEVAAMAERVVR